MEVMHSNPELQKIETQVAELKNKEAVMLAMRDAGVPEVDIDDESQVFLSAEKTIKDLVFRGLPKEAAVSIAAVEASMSVVAKTGSTIPELIESINLELAGVITILSKNTLTLDEEVVSGISKRIISLMTQSGISFSSALLDAIEERKKTVADLAGVSGFIDDEGVASFDNPRKDTKASQNLR